MKKMLLLLSFLVFFTNCSLFTKPEDKDKKEVILSKQAVELKEETLNNIISIDQSGTITFTKSNDSEQLKSGHIIFSEPRENIPHGFLKKIKNVTEKDDNIIITTTNATFEDLFEKANFEIEKQLSISDLDNQNNLKKGISVNKSLSEKGEIVIEINTILEDGDGNFETIHDQLRLEGHISINPKFYFSFDVEWFELKKLHFENTIIEDIELKLITNKELFKYNPEINLTTLHFSDIIFFVGPVPVVIVPVIPIKVGAVLSAGITSTAEITQSATLKSGIKYEDKSWSTISDNENSFDFSIPKPKASAIVKGYIEPRLELLLYGIAGPWAGVQGYVELDAEFCRTPWWKLYAGLEVNVGVVVTFLGDDLVDKKFGPIIEIREILAEAEPIIGSLSGMVLNAENEDPLPNIKVTLLKNGQIITEKFTTPNGGYYIEVESGRYDIETSGNGYLGSSYKEIFVSIDSDLDLEPIFQIDESFSGTGTILGSVRDSLTNNIISNVKLNIREGINNKEGLIAANTISDENGGYIFEDIEAGNYTLESDVQGYRKKYISVLSLGGKVKSGQDVELLSDNSK